MAQIALTIAGSDSGGGAGIQADLKTFSALGTYGASVVTAITAQNTQAVTAVHGVPIEVISAQIAAVLDDLDVKAVKIGMLATPEIITCVTDGLADFDGPVVLDPVLVAKSGDALLAQDAIATLRETLLPRATVLTPNLPEAACLLDQPEAQTETEMQAQGQQLCALGAGFVVMKGGHSVGEICHDLLVADQGIIGTWSAPRRNTKNTHGTGCTLSSAITAGLAKGLDLNTAVDQAHSYLQTAIAEADALQVGQGHGPVHHFHPFWSASDAGVNA